MVKPSAAIAIASRAVSRSTSTLTSVPGSSCSELNATMAMKPNANHGMVIFERSPPPTFVPRASNADRPTRNGASIITRTILVMTAASAAGSLIARPAATTWATSCTVAPVNTPKAVSSSGIQPALAPH
ncbi:hypothetical protein D3C81_1829950 [compost metagenome]